MVTFNFGICYEIEVQDFDFDFDFSFIYSLQKCIDTLQVEKGEGISTVEWCDNGKRILVGLQDGAVLLYDIKPELVEFKEEWMTDVNHVVDEMIQIAKL